MFIEIHNPNLWWCGWASLAGLFLLGHNFWLIAKKQSRKIRLEANTGHNFPISGSAVKPERVADFLIISPEGSAPVTNFRVLGNSLVADIEPLNNQSFYAALELRPHPITLEAEKFAGYIADEDAFAFVAPRFIKDQTIAPQRESYAKFAKVFCDTDKLNEAFLLKVGHKLEIVPLTDFADLLVGGKLDVQVLFENAPVAGLRVSSGCEEANEGRYSAHTRTGEDGIATLSIKNHRHWFVQTHFIRPHREDAENFEWESFWASLTFRI